MFQYIKKNFKNIIFPNYLFLNIKKKELNLMLKNNHFIFEIGDYEVIKEKMKVINFNIKILLNYQIGPAENENYYFYYEMILNFLDEDKLSTNFYGNLMKKNLPIKELNYIESNKKFRNLLRTYLPFVETSIQLFISSRDDFFNLIIYQEMEKGNFDIEIFLPEIEDISLKNKWENCLEIFFLSPKKKDIYFQDK